MDQTINILPVCCCNHDPNSRDSRRLKMLLPKSIIGEEEEKEKETEPQYNVTGIMVMKPSNSIFDSGDGHRGHLLVATLSLTAPP